MFEFSDKQLTPAEKVELEKMKTVKLPDDLPSTDEMTTQPTLPGRAYKMGEELKPGKHTSECWITLGVLLIGFLVQTGVVSATDATTLQGAITHGIEAGFAFVAQASVVIAYIRGRVEVKKK